MASLINKIVYSQASMELVAVANEFCKFLEQAKKIGKKDFIEKSLKILPYVYLKTSILPEIAEDLVYEAEKFVDESDWTYINNQTSQVLAGHNMQVLIGELLNQLSDDVPEVELSECYADIYQDLKDLSTAYSVANDQTMVDALWDVRKNFQNYWGIRLLYLQVSLHQLLYSDENLDAAPLVEKSKSRNTNNWLITKQMHQHQEDTDLDDLLKS